MSDQKSKTVMVTQGPDTRQTTARNGRRVEAAPTGLPHGHQPDGGGPEPGRRQFTPLAWLAATVAVVAVVVIAIVAGVTTSSEEGTPGGGNVETIIEPTVGSQEYLARLANQGYIPKEAVDRDLLLRESLENRGEIPKPSLESGGSDRLLDDLANQGRIPPEAAR